MKRNVLSIAVVSLGLTACNALGPAPSRFLGQNGPATSCDSTPAEENAVPNTTPPVEKATASGGQTASNQPNQSDPGARGVHNVMDRGGTATDSSTTTETRSQAGAPSVNQALFVPTTAETGGGGGGQSLSTQEAAKSVSAIRAALAVAATAEPFNQARVDTLLKALTDAQSALSASSVNDRPNVTNNINGTGATLTVENKSRSGGEGSDSGSVAKDAMARAMKQPPPLPAVPAPETPGMQ